MTELAEYQELHSDGGLVQWAKEAREAHLIAQSLSRTAFVSNTMKGKPEEITGAILTGYEMGLQPMSALRSIDIISGTPALRAIALRGLVQAAGHDVWVVESTDAKAVVAGKRKGSDHEQKSTWTIDRARKLGLADKDNYRKQPGVMLVARATAEVCRLIASDVLLGLPYAVEELEDLEEPTPIRRTAKRKALEPVPTESPEPPVEVEDVKPKDETWTDPEADPWAEPPGGDDGAA